MEKEEPISQLDLKNLHDLLGSNIEYYSEALALKNPDAPTNLSEILNFPKRAEAKIARSKGIV